MKRPSLCVALALSLCLPIARPASAQTAETLINQGLDLRERGEDQRALELFERAHAQSPSPRSLAQIALAEQALGRWSDAERHLTEALRGSADPFVARNQVALNAALVTIGERLGTLEIAGGVPGAKVKVNGQLAGALPLAASVRVPAGSAALEVSADGYLPVVRNVMVPAKGRTREFVNLVAVAQLPPQTSAVAAVAPAPAVDVYTPSAAAEDPPSWQRTTARVGVAAAVLSLGAGVIGTVVRESYASKWNDRRCGFVDGEVANENDCPHLRSAGRTATKVMIGGYALAAVFGVGSLVLWSSAPKVKPTSTAFLLLPGPGGLTVMGARRF